MTSDDEQSSDDVHKMPLDINTSTTCKLEEAIEERDETRDISLSSCLFLIFLSNLSLEHHARTQVRLVRLACLEMMKSLFGVHNDISILEHRNLYTVTKAFERSQIEPDRYRTYWPSNVPKLKRRR